jgi:dihydroneopterin aldolase
VKEQPMSEDDGLLKEGAKVFVRGLQLDAEIGVYDHEYGRHQPLVVDVELDISPSHWDRLADTINYETIATMAKQVAAEGHFQLVEAFAERLCQTCLKDRRVSRARVRIEKPTALAPAAAAAGAEIILARA